MGAEELNDQMSGCWFYRRAHNITCVNMQNKQHSIYLFIYVCLFDVYSNYLDTKVCVYITCRSQQRQFCHKSGIRNHTKVNFLPLRSCNLDSSIVYFCICLIYFHHVSYKNNIHDVCFFYFVVNYLKTTWKQKHNVFQWKRRKLHNSKKKKIIIQI